MAMTSDSCASIVPALPAGVYSAICTITGFVMAVRCLTPLVPIVVIGRLKSLMAQRIRVLSGCGAVLPSIHV